MRTLDSERQRTEQTRNPDGAPTRRGCGGGHGDGGGGRGVPMQRAVCTRHVFAVCSEDRRAPPEGDAPALPGEA